MNLRWGLFLLLAISTTQRAWGFPLEGCVAHLSAASEKYFRAARVVRVLFDPFEIARRKARLVELGYVDRAPTNRQLWKAATEMGHTYLLPGAKDYVESSGRFYYWHQFRRFLGDPAANIDPIGISVDEDTLVFHLLQSAHSDPRYDLQILQIFPGGVAHLQRDLALVVAGRHPRQKDVMATMERVDYHESLLSYIPHFLANENIGPMEDADAHLRAADPAYARAAERFQDFKSLLRYALTL